MNRESTPTETMSKRESNANFILISDGEHRLVFTDIPTEMAQAMAEQVAQKLDDVTPSEWSTFRKPPAKSSCIVVKSAESGSIWQVPKHRARNFAHWMSDELHVLPKHVASLLFPLAELVRDDASTRPN